MAIDTGIANTRLPGVYFGIDNSRATSGGDEDNRLLMIGQMLASGAAAPWELTRIVSDADADEKFGLGSMLAEMCKTAAAAHGYGEMWAVAALDDAAGVAATGALTISGSGVKAGTLSVMIGGARARVATADGDAPTEVAAALAAAINANVYLPVTATAAEAVVTVRARHKGDAGNEIYLGHSYHAGEKLPGGLTLAITAMSGGSGNPDIGDAISAMAAEKFKWIVSAWTDAANLDAITDELAIRWGAMRQMDGVCFCARRGTSAALSTFVGGLNSPYLVVGGVEPGMPTSPWIVAAAFAGQALHHLGYDPARPLTSLVLADVLPAKPSGRFVGDERNVLLRDGVSTFRVNPDDDVYIERAVTTYTQNALGVDDVSMADLCTVATLQVLRYRVVTMLGLKFARCKLANDNSPASYAQNIVRPKDVKAALTSLMYTLEMEGLVEDVAAWADYIAVEIDTTDTNRLNVYLPPNLIGQARVFAGVISYEL
ncbi:phage tail sheath subtilisin-like domain-containing protein [Desulfarculus baarsii]